MNEKIKIKEYPLLKVAKPFARVFFFFKGFRVKAKYKPEENESLFIVSNHVTDSDPSVIRLTIDRFLYTISTDSIFSSKIAMKWLPRFGVIPKRKGQTDFQSTMDMFRVIRNGGSLLVFPEGNRAYAEFQFYIAPTFGSLVKKSKATLLIYNISGGFGSYPRFMKKPRRGPLEVTIKRVLKYDEYKDMSDEEITKIIQDGIRVVDSESGNLYKSNAKAEYLERMFFVCPKCKSVSTLSSKGDYIHCHNCGLEVKYNENLTLSSTDPEFKYAKLVEWYDFQKDFVRDMKISEDVIFVDKNVVLKTCNPFELSKELARGDLRLTKDILFVGDFKINVSEIEIASPVSGRSLIISINGNNYRIKGDKRFNALKYVLLFNKLDTKMKKDKVDKYYNL